MEQNKRENRQEEIMKKGKTGGYFKRIKNIPSLDTYSHSNNSIITWTSGNKHIQFP